MTKALLATLPAVHVLADAAAAQGNAPRWAVVEAARRAIAAARAELLADSDGGGDGARGDGAHGDGEHRDGAGAGAHGDGARDGARGDVAARVAQLLDAGAVARAASALVQPRLRKVINATGVVLHTNLGRAPLSERARAAIGEAAGAYVNLEYDLATGERGSRHDHLRELLCELTGAEDALVVNNNAAAMVLCLAALASDKEIIVSRGELIEIGGSFRLPEILALSRGVLVEVGTTNKTHRKDYERAIRAATGLLLKVHRSNFAMVGFTSEVATDELVALGRAAGVPTMIDLGSGAMIDAATQRAWHMPAEPTVAEVVASGVDLVTFSGDKLLGGPQAGIAVGTRAAIAAARAHPLMRALRPDKLTIAGLAATLAEYRDRTPLAVPALHMLAQPAAALEPQARALAHAIGSVAGLTVAVEACMSTVGGGAMPTAELPSFAVTLAPASRLASSVEAAVQGRAVAEAGTVRSAERIDAHLRAAGIVARIADGRVWLDLRTIASDEHAAIRDSVRGLAAPAAS